MTSVEASAATGFPAFPTTLPRRMSAQHSTHTSTSHAQQLLCMFATGAEHASQKSRHPVACDASIASSASPAFVVSASASISSRSAAAERRMGAAT